MANSGEALFQRDIIEATRAYGWEVGVAGGWEHTEEEITDDKLHFVKGITSRIERNEVVMAKVSHHSEGQVKHGLSRRKLG